MRTLILGLGNPIFFNDRIGWVVAKKLFERIKGKGVFLKRTTLSGFNLLGLISGYEQIILVDSVAVHEQDFGRCFKVESETKDSSHHSHHQMSIFEVLRMAKKMNVELPPDFKIYAIGTTHSDKMSRKLNPQLQSKVDHIVEEIYQDLCTG